MFTKDYFMYYVKLFIYYTNKFYSLKEKGVARWQGDRLYERRILCRLNINFTR